MNDAATLIEAIAALVTAIGGAAAAIIVALKSSGRQRVAAAEEAARLAVAGHEGDRRGTYNAGPRHRAGTARQSGRDNESDDLVEQLQAALRSAEHAQATRTDGDLRDTRVEDEIRRDEDGEHDAR